MTAAGRKKLRRPPAFSNGLVVLTESLYADPADAPPGNAAKSNGTAAVPNGSSEPPPLSVMQHLKLVAAYQPAWRIHEQLEAAHPRKPPGGGRSRECPFIDVLIVLIFTWLMPKASKRFVLRQLHDPEIWNPVVAAVASAYPDDETRRLRPEPLSRRQFHTWRNVVAAHPDFKRLVDQFDEIAADVALDIGLLARDAPVTHPRPLNTLTADGKLAGALWKARIDQAVDFETGEVLRRCDPDALQYTATYQNRIDSDPDDEHDDEPQRRFVRQAGYHIVHTSTRGPHKDMRVPLSIRLLERPDPHDKKGECSLAVDMALRTNDYVTQKGGEISAAAYDGGMYSDHRSRFLDAGIIPVGRIQRGMHDAYAERNLGLLTFKLRDGTKRQIKAAALDGTPSIQGHLADGREITIGLERKKLQWDTQAGRKVLFGHWQVPDEPGVDNRLRGARTIIQHNNTDDDTRKGLLRTRALAVITENDPDYPPLFGHRQDSESLNSDFEGRLLWGRVGAARRNRVQLDLNGYQHSLCIRALIAHAIDHQTKRLPARFGEHELPDCLFRSETIDEP